MTKEGESWWSLVTGPTTAMLASLKRIGWLMPNAFQVVDDLGATWSFCSDAPAAIAAACWGSALSVEGMMAGAASLRSDDNKGHARSLPHTVVPLPQPVPHISHLE